MKKVGTISAAAGFIFLGVWMIIKQRNALLGEMLFKWWPIIIIVLGVELILTFSSSEEENRVRFNGLVVPVILIFLFVNVFNGIKLQVGEGFQWIRNSKNLNEVVDILRNIDDQNYKIIKAENTLSKYGSNFIFDADNADVVVRKAVDSNIRLEAEIYINKNRNDSSYEIKEVKESEGYKVEINESYIRKVKLNLYIPDGLNIKLVGNNLRLVSEEQLLETKFDTDVNNGSVDISYASSANLKMNNGKIDIKNVQSTAVKSNNSAVNIDGNAEVINIQMNNGVVSINNKLSKNVDIKMNSGTVKIETEDKNVNVTLQLDHGPSLLNGERRINAGISKTFGSGENKVNINVDNGMITFNN
jgi:predicted Zn-dependent protease